MAVFFAFMLVTFIASGALFAKEKTFSIIDIDPTAMEFRDKMSENPDDVTLMADYAKYCASRAWYDESLKYYKKALKTKKNDKALWVNVGAINMRMGKQSAAISAFKKAIRIDSNYAIAHYNLGAIYDSKNNYNAAITEYKKALILDPSLADPSVNPLIVNNTLMTVLNMLIYKETEGALSLPLQDVSE